MKFSRVFTHDGWTVSKDIKWTKRDAKITKVDGSVAFEQKDVTVPEAWSSDALNIVASKYFKKINGVLETGVDQLFKRVVDTIIKWGDEQGYFTTKKDKTIFHDELYFLLANQYASFNSPVYFNFGVPGRPQQGAACFILGVEDSMEAILDRVVVEGLIFKGGSGSGMNLSPLRSKNSPLSSGGSSSGPMSFNKGYDTFAGVIKSGGGTRRAAKMTILNATHPDIEDFITCKIREERKAQILIDAGYDPSIDGEAYGSVAYQNQNMSVRIPDDFMIRAENGDEEAIRILKLIADAAWRCGDPGVQFDDTINGWNTIPNSGYITSSNPCQPANATVLTPFGIRTFADIDVGSTIWSGKQWTTVIQKLETGIKPVYLYQTTAGVFIGTENHRIVEHGQKIEVDKAKAIDICPSPDISKYDIGESSEIIEKKYLGDYPVFDITVDCDEHTYWTGGLLVSNCGEFLSTDWSSCQLASFNLLKFYDGTNFDLDKFGNAVSLFTTALDIIIDGADYPDPRFKQTAHKQRQIGPGYSNLGALLMASGLPYDSDEGRDFAAGITAYMTAASHLQSAKIAAELGAFPDFEMNKSEMFHILRQHHEIANEKFNGTYFQTLFEAAMNLWTEAIELGEKTGFRNATNSLIAPTGTISFLMDCDTTGVEPDIALKKYKTLVGGGLMPLINSTIPIALKNLGYADHTIEYICSHVEKTGTIENSDYIDDEHLMVFDCAIKPQNGSRYIDYMAHVKMVAAVQPFLSMGVSKTINMPNSATVEDIYNLYFQAWKMGIKCMAVYRDGSKGSQPLNVSKKESKEEVKVISKPVRMELPKTRKSLTHKMEIADFEGYITVGMYDDGRPAELFITGSKQGSTVAGLLDSFAITVSLGLQYGVPLDVLVAKLTNSRFDPSGFTKNPDIRTATSIIDYIFRWMEQTFSKPTYTNGFADDRSIITLAENLIDKQMKELGVTLIKSGNGNGHVKTGEICNRCGSLMIRTGTCLTCTCGESLGGCGA